MLLKHLLLLNIALLFLILAFLAFAIRDSKSEKEGKAFNIFLLFSILILGFTLIILSLSKTYPLLLFLVPGSIFLCALVFLIPLRKTIGYEKPTVQLDERDIAFSRAELVEGTQNFRYYYKHNPHLIEKDNACRLLPGLTSERSMYYNKIIFEQTDQNFRKVKTLHSQVDKKAYPSPIGQPLNTLEAIKKEAFEQGIHSFGTCKTQSYHVYSHKGRGERYGEELKNELPFALAFTVEMDYEAMQHAPKAPVVLESSNQYLKSAQIAINLAEMISSWGFNARAHIDGNYHVICPLVAKDAGLGEIGRMGILMTPKLGPRVRIAVVTTDLKLPYAEVKDDLNVLDFCERCKICADACPTKAIQDGDRKNINGVNRWQINQDKCFTYWCKSGTDCGVCMKKCPYSHPDTLSHRIIRWGIKHSPVFRIAALWMEKRVYS